jgi:transcriptional regulator with XRE-family HTH domain
MTSEVMERPPRVRYREAMHSSTTTTPPPIGTLLRDWRQRRRLSQLDLAGEAEVSTRHLSYLETGRAEPSREMVLRLADRLDVPLRERNRWLAAAGYAPMFAERRFDDPALAAGRAAVEMVLKAHEPWPALAVDRHWAMIAHNAVVPLLIEGCAAELLQPPVNVLRLSLHPQGLAPRIANLREWRAHLLAGVDAALLQPPVNVLRLSLHPQGLAPRIVNLGQWRHHLFERLRQQIQATGDPALQALEAELRAYRVPPEAELPHLAGEVLGVAMPLQLRTPLGVLRFISTVTVFGTPVDVTLQELALETFFPADEATGEALRALAAGP